jgi:hypothetical protein
LSKQQGQGLHLCSYIFTGKDMTLEELEKMAQETAAFGVHPSGEYIYSFYTEQLQAFAKLVAQHERKRMAWTQGHWTEYEHNIASAEREACAKVCDEYADDSRTGASCARIIRARGQALDYEPYAFEASMYSNDRMKVDPVTGNVSIGTPQQEAKDEPWTPDDMAYRPDGLPQRTWVGLTDEEAAECWTYNDRTSWRNIEAKLKEKNNG